MNSNNDPLVRIGQGPYARDYHAGDFEGGSVAIVILIFVFVLGFVLGAWLW